MSIRTRNWLRVWVLAVAGIILVLPAFMTPASASQRVALVIGNAHYDHAPSLANPLNDADDISAALRRLGFEVTRIENADYTALRHGLRKFTRAASASEVAVVFYAGHGIEVEKHNFLVPTDARLQRDFDVENEAFPLDRIESAVARASKLSLIILDACRDNPFVASMKRKGTTRSIGRGLARVDPSGDMLIAYAAKEGEVAEDGEGRNSPFTTALLAYLEEPGLEVGYMFRKVGDKVKELTEGEQEPAVYGSLSSEKIYFVAPPEPAPPPEPVSPPEPDSPRAEHEAAAARAYEAAERVGTIDAFMLVVTSFPGTFYAGLAQSQIEKLTEAAEREAPPQEPPITREQADVLIAEAQAAEDEAAKAPAEMEATETEQEPPEKEGMVVAAVHPDDGLPAHIPAGPFPRDCATCPEMVVVPAGSFMMGSPSSEDKRDRDEGPRRRVTIPASFAVSKYEVTFAEWDACVAAGGCRAYRPDDEGWGRGQRPVINVSWKDAKAYVDWLSQTTGKRYRLLTEAEWEYVARAGKQSSWYWGDNVRKQCDHANGYDQSHKNEPDQVLPRAAKCNDGSRHTSPIGRFGENGFGVSDMLGNVWEWVEDCWNDSYAGAPRDGSALTSAGDCNQRVLRGGHWGAPPEHLRAANRSKGETEVRKDGYGIRAARTLN